MYFVKLISVGMNNDLGAAERRKDQLDILYWARPWNSIKILS